MKTYDLIIIGGGPGGYVAAIKAAQNNLKVALIEQEQVGGICLNHGCIPTKALLKSAKTYANVLTATEFGVNVLKEHVSFDLTTAVKRKNTVVRRLTGGVKMLLKKNGVEVFDGYGELKGNNTVTVNDQTLEAKHIILATGGSALIPPIKGVKEALKSGFAVTSKELLNPKTVPHKLAIIGGGVIGIEFANMFNAFGSEVTIIEMAETILTQMDDSIITEYSKILKKEGINVITNAMVSELGKNSLTYTKGDNKTTIETDLVLVAVGTKPNINAFEKMNIELEGSAVKVNEFMQTNINNIYAIGDLTGKHMLAHVASAEGIVAVNHILGIKDSLNYNQIPAAVYSFTEIASIGFTEKELKEKNIDYTVTTFPLMGNGKALADGEKDGFIKLLKDPKIDEILGAHILAYNAVDLINELSVAMKLESTNEVLANTVHAHPSLSEIIMEAAMKKPIHM